MPKRKVFIAYHHANEQSVVDNFIPTFSEEWEVFTDRSLERADDNDDTDYLNQVCRDAIDGTSVKIVMIGRQTGCRKFVDLEIRHTLFCQHGLVAISRPGLNDADACLPDRLNDYRKIGFDKWYKYPANAASLKTVIDEAYNAEVSRIDNSRKKMSRNRFANSVDGSVAASAVCERPAPIVHAKSIKLE
jgi:hypothetical protein